MTTTHCAARREGKRKVKLQQFLLFFLLLLLFFIFFCSFCFAFACASMYVPACSLRSARSLSRSLADCPLSLCLFLFLFLSVSLSPSLGILIISLRSIPLDCTHAAPASYWPAAEKYATLIVTSARRRQQQQRSSSVSSDDSSSSSTNGGRRQFKKAGRALQQNV